MDDGSDTSKFTADGPSIRAISLRGYDDVDEDGPHADSGSIRTVATGMTQSSSDSNLALIETLALEKQLLMEELLDAKAQSISSHKTLAAQIQQLESDCQNSRLLLAQAQEKYKLDCQKRRQQLATCRNMVEKRQTEVEEVEKLLKMENMRCEKLRSEVIEELKKQQDLLKSLCDCEKRRADIEEYARRECDAGIELMRLQRKARETKEQLLPYRDAKNATAKLAYLADVAVKKMMEETTCIGMSEKEDNDPKTGLSVEKSKTALFQYSYTIPQMPRFFPAPFQQNHHANTYYPSIMLGPYGQNSPVFQPPATVGLPGAYPVAMPGPISNFPIYYGPRPQGPPLIIADPAMYGSGPSYQVRQHLMTPAFQIQPGALHGSQLPVYTITARNSGETFTLESEKRPRGNTETS